MKNKSLAIILSVVLALGMCGGTYSYASHRVQQFGTFPEGITINGCEVSGLSCEDAKDKLTRYWNGKTLKIKEDGKTVGQLSDFALEYDIDDSLKQVMTAVCSKGILHEAISKEEDIQIEMTADHGKAFKNKVQNLDIAKSGYTVMTKDAYVDKSTTDFNIVKEVYGDNVDVAKLRDSLLSCVEKGQFEFDYNPEKYYSQPKVVSTDESLVDEQTYCKENLSYKITYTFGNETLTLTPEQLDSMANYENGVTVNKKAVKTFVGELASKYNTVGTYRSFKSTNKGVITVGGVGGYGYLIDQEAEIKKLTENLKAQKDVSREPVYSQTGNGRNGVNDLVGLYVEVDKANQHLYCYNGKTLLMDCPVVTGKVKCKVYHQTPVGVYYIYSKETHRYLRGLEDDGETEYESMVEYWMPFNGDIGLHDAYWVHQFGGTYYIKHGSHGCVNMPLASAGKLFGIVSIGTPVIVH